MSKKVDFERVSSYPTPEESLGYLLWRVSTTWRSTIKDTLRFFDLTHPQFVVLAAIGWLSRKGDLPSQAEVSRTSGLDPNTTSQIVRGLEMKKLIKRVQSKDERSKNPILTAAGSNILTKALPVVERTDKKFFESLDINDSEKLVAIFQKLTDKK